MSTQTGAVKPRRRRRWPWWVLGSVVVVIAAVAAMVLLGTHPWYAVGPSDEHIPSKPKTIVTRYLEAMQKGDPDEMRKYADELGYRFPDAAVLKASLKRTPMKDIHVDKVTEDGDYATLVDASFTLDGKKVEWTYTVYHSNGEAAIGDNAMSVADELLDQGLKINGVPVDEPVQLPPGTYTFEITDPDFKLTFDPEQPNLKKNMVTLTERQSEPATNGISLEVSEHGRKRAWAALKSALEKCYKSTKDTTDCGLNIDKPLDSEDADAGWEVVPDSAKRTLSTNAEKGYRPQPGAEEVRHLEISGMGSPGRSNVSIEAVNPKLNDRARFPVLSPLDLEPGYVDLSKDPAEVVWGSKQ